MNKIGKLAICMLCLFLAILLIIYGIFCIGERKIINELGQGLDDLNTCYDIIVDCHENGFNKDTARENKEILKRVLEKDISVQLYVYSDFYESKITFSRGLEYPNFGDEMPVYEAAHTRDLVLAMYLTCVLSTEPDNLSTELNWLLDGSFEMYLIPEFVFLTAYNYPLTQNEFDLITKSFLSFSHAIDDSYHRYNTLQFPFMLSQLYNERDDTNKIDEQVLQQLLQESMEIKEEIDDDVLEKTWVGYNPVLKKYAKNRKDRIQFCVLRK